MMINVYRSNLGTDLIDTLLRLNGLETMKEVMGRYVRVGFYSKKPLIKNKPMTHFCFSLQLVADFDELTKHRLEAIKDQCKAKFT